MYCRRHDEMRLGDGDKSWSCTFLMLVIRREGNDVLSNLWMKRVNYLDLVDDSMGGEREVMDEIDSPAPTDLPQGCNLPVL